MKTGIIVTIVTVLIILNNTITWGDPMETDLRSLAQSVQSQVVKWRRCIHRYPGLRFTPEETATLRFIREEIEKFSLAGGRKIVFQPSSEGGLVINVSVDPLFDRILFRADVDALPIQEETGLSFVSTVPGVMHACGHDTHAAMLLGALKLILEGKVELKHNLRIVFQRAEENPVDGTSGGKILVAEGVCERIRAAFALHIKSDFPAGQFFASPSHTHANSDRVCLKLNGVNPDVLTDLHLSLRGFGELHLSPLAPHSFVPTISFGIGTSSNIRPAHGEIGYKVKNSALLPDIGELVRNIAKRYPDAKVSFVGEGENLLIQVHCTGGHVMRPDNGSNAIDIITDIHSALRMSFGDALEAFSKSDSGDVWYAARNFLGEEERDAFAEAVRKRTEAVLASYPGASLKFKYVKGHPAFSNTQAEVKRISTLLENSGEKMEEIPPMLGGEDFGYYLGKCPGTFIHLGAHQEGSGGHHTATFNPDESVFWKGVLLWLLLATN